MDMTKKALFTILLGFLMLLTGSCNKKEVVVTQDLLTGTWQLNTITEGKVAPITLKKVFYQFLENGNLLITEHQYESTYTYSLNCIEKTLELTPPEDVIEGKASTWIIDTLSEEVLVIHQTRRQAGCSREMVLCTLSFTRVQ
jgi:hypothetical protein